MVIKSELTVRNQSAAFVRTVLLGPKRIFSLQFLVATPRRLVIYNFVLSQVVNNAVHRITHRVDVELVKAKSIKALHLAVGPCPTEDNSRLEEGTECSRYSRHCVAVSMSELGWLSGCEDMVDWVDNSSFTHLYIPRLFTQLRT
jgi:hypothetical protein